MVEYTDYDSGQFSINPTHFGDGHWLSLTRHDDTTITILTRHDDTTITIDVREPDKDIAFAVPFSKEEFAYFIKRCYALWEETYVKR